MGIKPPTDYFHVFIGFVAIFLLLVICFLPWVLIFILIGKL